MNYLEGHLQQATKEAGPGVQRLLQQMEIRVTDFCTKAFIAIRAAAERDGISAQEVEKIFVAQSLYEVASFSSAFSAIHKTMFDPQLFGRHAEAIAREFAPIFSEVEAEEDSKN